MQIEIMRSFFEFYRKEVITGAGVLLFMIAGTLAMIILPSDKSTPINESNRQTQNTNHEPESNLQNHESESNRQNHESESNNQNPVKDIYVYMTGAVKKPGVYKFPEGSRIFEVVEAAGGFTDKADIAALNLAETFSDAQHIHIPMKGEQPRINTNVPNREQPRINTNVTVQSQRTESNVNRENQNLVDINHASESELQRLKGVGPAIAKRIYEYRRQHGRFNSPEDLINVRGIGPVKLEKMREQIIIR